MKWFRRSSSDQPQVDPARQEALIADVRQRFGAGGTGRFVDQVTALTPVLQDDDGLAVAARIVHEVGEQTYVDVYHQAAALGYGVDRRNYRVTYRATGPRMRYRLETLPCGFHPYVHLSAAVGAIGGNPKRAIALDNAPWLLNHMLELLELTAAGWEYGEVPVGVDAAHLANRLISTSTQIRHEIDEPPLTPGLRQVMRSNRTTPVRDQNGTVVGGFNMGAEMRKAFLT